jgi:serpin B
MSPDAPAEDVRVVAEGNNAFGFDLYQALRAQAERGNLFFSPYSLSSALAMAYAGARGETAAQMAQALHFDLPHDQRHAAYNALDLALTMPGGEGAFTLRAANSLWGQADFTFRPDFLDTLAVNYGAGLRLADFKDEAAREQARQAINAWVARETEDKITELFKPGVLTPDARLVLANALYFQGLWETPFAPESPQAPFTLRGGEVISVTTMGRRAMTPYAAGDDYQAVALPYQGGRAEMLVLVPTGDLAAFEQTLSAERLSEIVAALEPQDVKLYLPRFSFASELSLAQTLAALGMADAFDEQRADFSGMTDEARLVLRHVAHQAVVAVDELGTEAAAATGIVAEIVSMPTEVRADKPFVFVIRDKPTGTVLSVGRVVDPR